MQTKEFYSMLKQLGIPVAYSSFKHKVEPPFAVYFESRDVYGDDFKNSIINASYTIELYEEARNIELESKLEKLLDDNGFNYSVDYGTYIDTERMFMTIYNVDSLVYKKG